MDNEKCKEFIDLFFACLGFKNVQITLIRSGKLYGKIYYQDDEYEEIRWNFITYPVTDDNVIRIIDILLKYMLVEIDQIKITRKKLYELFSKHYGKILNYKLFEESLNNLESIKIDRID